MEGKSFMHPNIYIILWSISQAVVVVVDTFFPAARSYLKSNFKNFAGTIIRLIYFIPVSRIIFFFDGIKLAFKKVPGRFIYTIGSVHAV